MSDNRSVMVILVSKRSKSALDVQKVLTESGGLIKTRLGIHDGAADKTSDSGLIILELVGEQSRHAQLASRLGTLDGVSAKLIELAA